MSNPPPPTQNPSVGRQAAQIFSHLPQRHLPRCWHYTVITASLHADAVPSSPPPSTPSRIDCGRAASAPHPQRCNTPCYDFANYLLINLISVLILHQIPWLIHFKEFEFKNFMEKSRNPKFWNSKLLLMSLLIIQVQFGSSSSNCNNSGNFDQIHQISFEFKHLELFLIFNSNSRLNFEKFQ
jgi:hypothetical protein